MRKKNKKANKTKKEQRKEKQKKQEKQKEKQNDAKRENELQRYKFFTIRKVERKIVTKKEENLMKICKDKNKQTSMM